MATPKPTTELTVTLTPLLIDKVSYEAGNDPEGHLKWVCKSPEKLPEVVSADTTSYLGAKRGSDRSMGDSVNLQMGQSENSPAIYWRSIDKVCILPNSDER